MTTQQLVLNIIPFTPPITIKKLSFYKERKEGYSSVYIDTELVGLLDEHLTGLERADIFWLYTDFGDPQPGAIIIDIDLTHHIDIANHYYRHLIFKYFQNGVAHIMRRNFTKEVEVWFLSQPQKSADFKTYDQFTIKVQHNGVTSGPELVLSYDGHTKVYKQSMAELMGMPTEDLSWVTCGGLLYKWEFLPDEWMGRLDEVFPVISNKLKPWLGIASETRESGNRYVKHHSAIVGFYDSYLNNENFRTTIPIADSGFIQAPAAAVRKIGMEASLLQFGNSSGRVPKTDLKAYGPCSSVPPPRNIKFFFIYQQADAGLIPGLKDCFLNGLGYHPSMGKFINLPFSIDDTLNIKFDEPDKAVRTIWDNIKSRTKQPNIRYFAIYISPIPKDETDIERHRIYYRIKEMLLNSGYLSQVIYKENIVKPSFNYFLPNIQVAILAKLGGIPWRLKRDSTNELIVGIGAFHAQGTKHNFVGSAFCFNNQGQFKGFDCFNGEDTYKIAGSIRHAVERFHELNPNATRLIIHFYKLISQEELKPILETLYHELKLDIPVIIVTVNKTASKELLAFDLENKGKLMPYSGIYIRVAERQYLLFNNTRYTEGSKLTDKEYHFPVKIKLTSTNLSLLEDEALVDLLIDQVYQFSRMYWKSVSQQNLPVTLSYPEMIAKIFPHFRYEKLPPYGHESLWFL